MPCSLSLHHSNSHSLMMLLHSAGGGYSRGYGGYSSAPSVTVMPRTSLSFGGFGYGGFGGFGYGGGYGYGAPVVSSGGGGGGLFTLLALGVLGFAALQLLPQLTGGGSDESGELSA